jgi:DNA-binding response OmpR family regulator
VRERWAGLPVLLCTGLADDRALALARAFAGVELLPKPFDARELAAAIARALPPKA